MKKTNITISFETEKLEALHFYSEKKDVDLTAELADTIQKLYEKVVPQPTREYIEAKVERDQMSKNKAQKKNVPKASSTQSNE